MENHRVEPAFFLTNFNEKTKTTLQLLASGDRRDSGDGGIKG